MDTIKLCSPDVVTIRPFEELVAAAKLMRERHVGYLVVVEPLFGDGGNGRSAC